jgi:hypothetical protein
MASSTRSGFGMKRCQTQPSKAILFSLHAIAALSHHHFTDTWRAVGLLFLLQVLRQPHFDNGLAGDWPQVSQTAWRSALSCGKRGNSCKQERQAVLALLFKRHTKEYYILGIWTPSCPSMAGIPPSAGEATCRCETFSPCTVTIKVSSFVPIDT